MIDADLFKKIKIIFVDILKCDESEIQENSSAENIGQWDSLAHIRLILEIEQQFNIKFSLGELQDLKNIKELIKLVSSKL